MAVDPKAEIQAALRKAIEREAPGQNSERLYALERPKQASHGDFASSAALQLAKLLKRNPRDVAAALSSSMGVYLKNIATLSIDGPAYDLLVTLSKFLCLGLTLPEVVRCATVAPAAAIGREELGTLAPGTPGDASVLDLARGEFDYVDVVGEHVRGDQRLMPIGAVRGGRWEAVG